MKRNVPVQSLIDHIKTAIDVDPWAKEMVETMLKEKEATKPTRVNTNYEQHWNCGNCNAVISGWDKFCHECGKRIEWERR